MKIWSIEGNRQWLDGGSLFGNAPRMLWQQWIEPDEQNRIELACRCLLAENLNGLNVLFEAGVGAFFKPKLKKRFGVQQDDHVLLRSLQARGISHDEIDIVVLSHLHFDHAGGILSKYEAGQPMRLLFPKAKFLVGETAWERARNPHPRDRASFIPELPKLLEASGRLELVTGDRSATLGDAVQFRYSDGHTLGLMLSEIGGNGGVLYSSDLVAGRPWVHLPISMGIDRYPELGVDEKHALLDDIIRRGIRLFFTHDLECAMALPVTDDQGRYTTTDEQETVEGMMLN